MATKVPQKSAFDIAGKYQVYLTWCELGACLFSVVSTALSFFEFYAYIENSVTMISVAFLISICFFQMRFRSTYREAESVRRDGLIDHCFGTIMADTQSEGYYDSVDIDSGFKKLLASIHESSLLSSVIVDDMLKRQERLTFIGGIFVVIACIARSIQSELLLAILNGFLSLRLLDDYCELHALRTEIRNVLEKCKHICEDRANSRRKTFSAQQQAHLIRECIRYECALAYASIMLDEDLYQQLNPTHEKAWKAIKERYYD